MKLKNILSVLRALGLDTKDVLQSVLHYATPQLAKPLFRELLSRTSGEKQERMARILRMAADEMEKQNDEAAAGNLARFVGEVKW